MSLYPNYLDYVQAGLFSLAGLVAFAISVYAGRTGHERLNKIALGNSVPLFVSALTYLVLEAIDFLPFLRWVGYTVACGFFAYETALTMRQSESRATFSGIFMSATLFTGFIPYFLPTLLDQWLIFGVGSLAYLVALWLLALNEELKLPEGYARRLYLVFFIFVWSIYPIIYGLGPVIGNVYARDAEDLAYFILEFFAKYAVAAINICFAWNETRKGKRLEFI